jgi:plastocyanin
MRRIPGVWTVAIAIVVAVLAGACGDGRGGDEGGFEPAKGGEERTVLIDYRHDQFASAFLQYYPEHLEVRPGDLVKFRQSWTGEPHSVTMGKVVNDLFEFAPLIMEYDSAEAALAGGVSQEQIDRVLSTLSKIPGMTDDFRIAQGGAEPCFVAEVDDVPAFSNAETDEVNIDARCPVEARKQVPFTGRQALYNSGFIPYDGPQGNTFEVPIAEDAEPGTYKFFCNYHWIFMSGEVEVVEKGAAIPTQAEVSRKARQEIDADAKNALAKVAEVKDARVGDEVDDLTLPLVGRNIDEETPVIINEFFPRKVSAKVGQKITWTVDGATHTVSFNVPKYFPIFTVADDGEVTWDPKSFDPVGFDVPPPDEERPESEDEAEAAARTIDAGDWDGTGGFHSSGALEAGTTFSVTFTKAGTYPFACVLHPQMVGTVEVR